MKSTLITASIFSAIISVGQTNMEIREISTATPTENTQNQEPEIFTMVEEMPEFPGGVMEMMKFIQTNIKYPNSAKEKGVGGKCFVKFVVRADGTITDVSIIKGVENCIECDQESMRVVKLMPKWKPARQSGKAVSVFYNLPINFTMKNGR